jgi:hypothetical protein
VVWRAKYCWDVDGCGWRRIGVVWRTTNCCFWIGRGVVRPRRCCC